jgi:XRE family aerobic/anaerobic benzoate catabolism transcriptional regulator
MSPELKNQADAARATAAAKRLPQEVSDERYLTKLGERVRAARRQNGFSRKLLAEMAGLSERYLAQLESGEGNASIILLRRVARALGMRVTELLEAEQPPELRAIARLLDSLPPQRLGAVLQHLMRDFGSEESMRGKRIALIGLRGAGKSTLGSALAKQVSRAFIELDREIETDAGMALAEIFLLYGRPGYRRVERRCLERVISSQRDVILSVGGGVVDDSESLQMLLDNCFTVWIKTSPAEHMARVVAQGDMRPMKGHSQAMQDLKNILASREVLYARADAVVDTSGRTIEKSLAALRRVCASQIN